MNMKHLKLKRKQDEKAFKAACICLSLTPEGKAFLRVLIKQVLMEPVMAEIDNNLHYATILEGKRHLVRQILNQLKPEQQEEFSDEYDAR